MSIASRQRQAARLAAAGLTKPAHTGHKHKHRDYTPPALNITDLAVQSARANQKAGREEKSAKLGLRGAHGNGYLTHEQRTEASMRRMAIKQIAQLHNENKIPLQSTKKEVQSS